MWTSKYIIKNILENEIVSRVTLTFVNITKSVIFLEDLNFVRAFTRTGTISMATDTLAVPLLQ